MDSKYKIGIIGGGSWATALAKIILSTQGTINWCLRSSSRIKDFQKLGHNPSYLKSVPFDTKRINFYSESDANEFARQSDVIILCVPSPYIRSYLKRIRTSILRTKIIVNAVKGMIPEDNLLISEYLEEVKEVNRKQIGMISGPCHAEEVAKERRSYLTLACFDLGLAKELQQVFSNDYIRCSTSRDVVGVEYASVLKNVYAIAAGICNGLNYGDNFQSVLISNAIAEMNNFINIVHLIKRNVTESVYLGDLLVTAYSDFSRNRKFGTMLGEGYSVKKAQKEMEMTAEGFYGCKCIHEVNKHYGVDMPLAETVYQIVHNNKPIEEAIEELSLKFK